MAASLLDQPELPRRSESYASLDALRGLAAILVVFYHLQNIFTTHLGVVPLGGLFTAGNRGVDLFFVLSGFVIMTAHAGDVGVPGRATRYVYKRLCRIYPSVWIVTLAALVLYALHFGGPDKGSKLRIGHVIASALLVPQHGTPLVNVTWTLTYEIGFYASFALVILNRWAGIAFIAAWQAIVALIWIGGFGPVPTDVIWLRPICLEFGIGVAGALLVRNVTVRGRWPLRLSVVGLLAGAGLFVAGMAIETRRPGIALEHVRVLVYGIGSGLAMVGVTTLERVTSRRVPRALVRLGHASYAIYLVHFSVITLVAVALVHLHAFAIGNGLMIGSALLAIGTGIVFHLFVDKPIQSALRGLGRRLFEQTKSAGFASSGDFALDRRTGFG